MAPVQPALGKTDQQAPGEPCWRSLWLPSRCRQPGLTPACGACPASLGQGRPAGPPVSHVGGRYGCRAVAGTRRHPACGACPASLGQGRPAGPPGEPCWWWLWLPSRCRQPGLTPACGACPASPWARPTSRPTKWAMLAVGVPSMSKKPSTSQTSMKPIRAGGMARPQSGCSLVRSQL